MPQFTGINSWVLSFPYEVYAESKKMIQVNLSTKHRVTYVKTIWLPESEWGMGWEVGIDIYTRMYIK